MYETDRRSMETMSALNVVVPWFGGMDVISVLGVVMRNATYNDYKWW